jgi:cellulose synthase/poly-beta-1,6-N-acetylglucosamine synthase-like glycosyltransferase
MENIQGKPASNPDFLPKVSVIIPIYNGADDLPELILSLCAQTYPGHHVEYFLVDNASQDETSTILEKAASDTSQHNIRIIPLDERKIQSSYAARNRGILSSTGEILVFTDVDCRPQPDWLYQLVKPFADPIIGAVGGAIKPLPGTTFFEKYAAHQQILAQENHLSTEFLPFAATANLAIRREIFAEIGLFRPYMTTGGDADFCWRIQKNSHWRLYFEIEAIVFHRHRTSLKGLLMQHHRYGRAMHYLDELYGIEMLPESKWSTHKYLQSLKHWLFKEAPPILVEVIKREKSFGDLLMSPITILVRQSFAIGRMRAKLPEAARQIQYFQ